MLCQTLNWCKSIGKNFHFKNQITWPYHTELAFMQTYYVSFHLPSHVWRLFNRTVAYCSVIQLKHLLDLMSVFNGIASIAGGKWILPFRKVNENWKWYDAEKFPVWKLNHLMETWMWPSMHCYLLFVEMQQEQKYGNIAFIFPLVKLKKMPS